MSNSTLKATIQFRRNYTEDWELYKNTIPAAGEPCFDLDLKTLKIGDGVTTYENLHAIGGISLSVDNKTIIISDDTFKLFGFDAAEIGAQPRKGENSKLEWIVPSGETLEGLQTIVSGLQTDLANLQTDVSNIQEVLNSSSDGKKPLLDRVIILEDQMIGIEAGAEVNVQANWNETDTTSDAYIANKPTIPSKTSDLTNDSGFLTSVPDEYITETELAAKGYLTSYTETDPTVPDWAKQSTKPTYTAAEVGALPDTTTIPSKTSELTNDSGFLTAVPDEYITETELTAKGYLTSYTETDPTVPAWAKADTKPTYTADEVGALPADTVIPSIDGLASETYVDNAVAGVNAVPSSTTDDNDKILMVVNGIPTWKEADSLSITSSDDGAGNVTITIV